MEENPLQASIIQQCFGGNRAQALTRSNMFTCPDDESRLMICAGDEVSSSVSHKRDYLMFFKRYFMRTHLLCTPKYRYLIWGCFFSSHQVIQCPMILIVSLISPLVIPDL